MTLSKHASVPVAFILSISTCYAGDAWLSLGKGPSSDGGGTSLAIGAKVSPNIGLELGVVFNTEFSNKEVLDYPVPHNNYKTLGTKRTGNAIGLDVVFFASDSNLKPYLSIGIYTSDRNEIAQSNATGWYYNQSNKSKTMIAGGIGIQGTVKSGLILGVGYHNIRGGQISIGKTF